MPEELVDAARLDELAGSSDGQGGTLLAALAGVLTAEEAPACLAGFNEALATNDGTLFSRFGHRLKGTAMIFGAGRLTALCTAAERGEAAATADTLALNETELAALEAVLADRLAL